jgi:hypothetical protein
MPSTMISDPKCYSASLDSTIINLANFRLVISDLYIYNSTCDSILYLNCSLYYAFDHSLVTKPKWRFLCNGEN